MVNIINWICVIINPSYWLMNHPFNEKWDQKLRGLLSEDVVIENRHKASFGGVGVWVENHPYASFAPLDSSFFGSPIDIRPSRVTILKAGRIIRKHMKEHKKAELEALTNHIYS